MRLHFRLCACLFLLTLAACPVLAQQFSPTEYYRIGLHGAEPNQIVAADFNGDGNLDLAVADTEVGGVALLFGNGDGTFRTAKHMNIADPYALAVADMNGDGIPDLLVLSETRYLFVYLGRGDGTFYLKAKYLMGDYPVALAVADLNGDGKLDVVVADSDSDQKAPGYVTVFFGNGNGTLTYQTHYSAGINPWGLAIGDLNGDGHPDIVVANDNAYDPEDLNTLYILLNNGNGTFSAGAVYQTGAESLNVSIADLNGDGVPDLVVASAFNQGIMVLLGNGNGTFADPVFYSTSSFGAAPYDIAIADFNQDGIPDIATVIYQGGIVLFYGNGDGTFQPAVSAGTINQAGGLSLVTADFNNDGLPDLAASQFYSDYAVVLLNAQ
jgi:hypothetical protein